MQACQQIRVIGERPKPVHMVKGLVGRSLPVTVKGLRTEFKGFKEQDLFQ